MGFLTLFFLRNAVRSRRIMWMAVLGVVPFLVAVVMILVPPLLGRDIDASGLFRELSFSMYLHILLPLLSALIGTGIIADEIDERTLPYLLTRPVPKWRIVISKSLAACVTTGMILVVSLFVAYTVMSAGGGPGAWLSNLPMLLHIAAVLLLGVLVYVPLFGLLGASIKKPVLAGLLFAFVWENIAANMPSRIRLLTIVTYLHELFPGHGGEAEAEAGGLSSLLESLVSRAEVSAPASVAVLLVMFLVFTGLTVSLLYLKEYRLEQA